jgi:hypothetical protein
VDAVIVVDGVGFMAERLVLTRSLCLGRLALLIGSGSGLLIEPDRPLHVAGDVGHADLHGHTGQACRVVDSLMRCFCSATTCWMAEQTADLARSARRCGQGRSSGFLTWIIERRPKVARICSSRCEVSMGLLVPKAWDRQALGQLRAAFQRWTRLRPHPLHGPSSVKRPPRACLRVLVPGLGGWPIGRLAGTDLELGLLVRQTMERLPGQD